MIRTIRPYPWARFPARGISPIKAASGPWIISWATGLCQGRRYCLAANPASASPPCSCRWPRPWRPRRGQCSMPAEKRPWPKSSPAARDLGTCRKAFWQFQPPAWKTSWPYSGKPGQPLWLWILCRPWRAWPRKACPAMSTRSGPWPRACSKPAGRRTQRWSWWVM